MAKRAERARSETANTEKTENENVMRLERSQGIEGMLQGSVRFISTAYNSETKELWGRTWLSWTLILTFYFCFYCCLIAFSFAIGSFWGDVILNRDSPKYSGPDDGLAYTPGVSHIPIIDPDKRSTLIRFSRSNDTQVGSIKDYMYETFLKFYEPQYWSSENGNFIDCTGGRTDTDIEKVCEFKLDYIRPCVLEDDYGWGDGQPCIILKLNKVNNWVPENYDSISEVPDEIKDVWKKNVITVKCFGSDPVSRENVGEIEYYPQQGWSFDYYPFTGQQGYKSPLVAAQFMSLPHRMAVFITCKAYTKNMIYHQSYWLGQTKFEIISD